MEGKDIKMKDEISIGLSRSFLSAENFTPSEDLANTFGLKLLHFRN
jgi:hypothetical protein